MKQRYNLIPILFFLTGSTLVLLLVLAHQRIDNNHFRQETVITAEQVALRLESCINGRIRLIDVIADYPWNNRAEIVNDWSGHVRYLYPLFDGVQALNYIDNDYFIRATYPLEENRLALNVNLLESQPGAVINALTEAARTGQNIRSEVITLLFGDIGFIFFKPIHNPQGEQLGFVDGVFKLQQLMDTCLIEAQLFNSYHFQLLEQDNTVIYQHPVSSAQLAEDFTTASLVDINGKPLMLRLSPSPAFLRDNNSPIDELWFSVGLLLVSLLSWVLRSLLLKQLSLKENQEKYRILVENQNDMVVKINTQGEFQYVSPSYCTTFGLNEDKLLGHPFIPLVHEDDQELTQASLQKVISPPFHSYHEQRALTKAGWRYIAWSNAAVFDKNGNIEGITAVGRDVTNIKTLEGRVAHAEKMQAMGNMAGGITHDFNNLLQVLLGYIEFMKLKNEANETLQEDLQQLCKVIDRAMILVAKLATLSNQDNVSKKPIDVNRFTTEVIDLCQPSLPSNISIKVYPSPQPLYIEADRGQLEQVLLNLCFNARDAIKTSGKIEIQITSHYLDEESAGKHTLVTSGEYVCIKVTDNGSGIPQTILSRIFEPFFSTKQKGSGTGLGLANCYSIIRQNNGDIRAESTEGEGSVFTLYLPLYKGDITSTEPESESFSVAHSNDGNGKLILVVDDNPDILRLTCSQLEYAGFQTVNASNGQEAVLRATQLKYKIDLVLMDVLMPVLGGREAAKQISRLRPDLKIVFMSGYTPQDEDQVNQFILRKPFTREQLIQAINIALVETTDRKSSF